MADVFRGPLYSLKGIVRPFIGFVAPNLLRTTLADPVKQLPSGESSLLYWTLVSRPALTWTQNLLQTTLEGFTQTTPFIQADWPLPRRIAKPDLTWNGNLLQTTLEGFTQTTPFTQLNWPIQVLLWKQDRSTTQNLLQTTLAVVVTAPFFQVDWPLLRERVREDVTWTWTYLPAILARTDPFTQLEWVVPRRIKAPDLTWVQNLLQGTLEGFTQTTPFVQLDWPTLQGVRGFRGELPPNLLGTTLSALEAAPFFQIDWPVPPTKFFSRETLTLPLAFRELLVPTLSRLTALSLGLSPELSQTITWAGNVLPVSITTLAPVGAPPGNKGIVFRVSGGVGTIYIWDGSAWVTIT